MSRPRKQTYTLDMYLNKNKDGDISNDADTQRKPAWKTIVNGLIVTTLTDDYIPSYSVKPKSIDFTGFDDFYLPQKRSRE